MSVTDEGLEQTKRQFREICLGGSLLLLARLKKMHLHACGVWVYAHRQWITHQQRCFFWTDASFVSASHSRFLNVATYAAVLLGKETNQPFFIEHFPELCLHVICLVSNTQTKRTGITFICLTSTALNHLKLRNISAQTVEGRQTIKNNAVDFFRHGTPEQQAAAFWWRQKSNLIYIISQFSLHHALKMTVLVSFFTGARLSTGLLAVRTQTLIIFWAKGILFIHDGNPRPTYTFRIHISKKLRLQKSEQHFSKVNPAFCTLSRHSTINWIMVGLHQPPPPQKKTWQSLRLLYDSVKCEYCNRQCTFLPVMRARRPQQRQQLKPAGVGSMVQTLMKRRTETAGSSNLCSSVEHPRSFFFIFWV